jgi:hypothetical protein
MEDAAAFVKKPAALWRMSRFWQRDSEQQIDDKEFRGEALLDSGPAAASAFLPIAPHASRGDAGEQGTAGGSFDFGCKILQSSGYSGICPESIAPPAEQPFGDGDFFIYPNRFHFELSALRELYQGDEKGFFGGRNA